MSILLHNIQPDWFIVPLFLMQPDEYIPSTL